MSAVVIDASAGTEIVADTRRGRALAALVPVGVEGWVPEHFYAEVLGVLRHQLLVEKLITDAKATAAVVRCAPGTCTVPRSRPWSVPPGLTGTT